MKDLIKGRSIWILLVVFIATSMAGCGEQDKSDSKRLDSAEKQITSLEKFDDMKFGMFIHWGLYAIPAGEWKGTYVRGIGEWIMRRVPIPVEEYEQLAKQFNPQKFNAEDWSRLAKDAGMKYMVITAKHHDGFAMYHSKVSDYNIVDATPFDRDPLKELSESNANQGIGFGFYYSQAQDWHEPNAAGNDWDFLKERDPAPYVQGKALPQIEELLSNYGKLALIWFDTPQLLTKEQVIELRQMVKNKQPDCLVNSRIGHGQGDYDQMGDNAIPTNVYSKNKWEIPATLNDTWGYKKMDHNWKQPRELIYKLSDIVSKGGNYLLNVGPTDEGIIPVESQQILREVGKWLKVNGESIYGTTPSLFYNDQIHWKCTVKPYRVYIHIVNWPGESIEIKGLLSKVQSAKFLANGQQVNIRQDEYGVQLDLPSVAPDTYNSVVVLEIEDDRAIVSPEYRHDFNRTVIPLYAIDARIRGEEVRYDWSTHSCSGFIKSENPKNELWWYHFPQKSGKYLVQVEYAAQDEESGSEIVIRNNVGNEDMDMTLLNARGRIENTSGVFKTFDVDTLQLKEGTENRLQFTLVDNEPPTNLKVRKIVLNKVQSK